ncbi:hypothetical protein BJ170DRAFT_686886 [Xylariales sp. AK1849]|nr:hypothetical protein BJ170DRAFT_686886 [Xylariales sp. AK1849]
MYITKLIVALVATLASLSTMVQAAAVPKVNSVVPTNGTVVAMDIPVGGPKRDYKIQLLCLKKFMSPPHNESWKPMYCGGKVWWRQQSFWKTPKHCDPGCDRYLQNKIYNFHERAQCHKRKHLAHCWVGFRPEH